MSSLRAIRILFAEDTIADAELAIDEIKKANIEFSYVIVETEKNFVNALENFRPDIVVSDYMMPSFTGMRALKIVRERKPNHPFIILTGSMNEDTAVACMKAGANDYVLKDHMARLPFALIETLSKSREKDEKESALRSLGESEDRYKALFHDNAAVMLIFDSIELAIVDANPAACTYYGWPYDELVGKRIEAISARPLDDIKADLQRLEVRGSNHYEGKDLLANGEIRDVDVYAGKLRSSQRSMHYTIVHDITDRKKAESLLKKRARELAKNQEATISSMAILAEYRDRGTGAHIQRTKEYVKLLLEKSERAAYRSREDFDLIWQSAALHDIGKIGIPDSILLKPGKLTPEEFELMKTHTTLGSDAISKAEAILGEGSFLSYAREIAEFHHERWDGTGYPHGLKGEEIPFVARVMAIADVYDALVTERPYKRPIMHDEAVAVMKTEAGSHFDPGLVEIFLRNEKAFLFISSFYLD
ncbi:MAG: HD domain-containing phosphohydrolase [Rectinemataceae bacterium]